MTELTDASGAFGYGDSILVGDRVRLRGVRDAVLPAHAREVEMGSRTHDHAVELGGPAVGGRGEELIAKWSANEKDDLGFAVETLDDPPVLVGNIGLWCVRPKDRCATLGIALGREYIGRGYGTDAVRVIVGYAFREMGLHRIQLQRFVQPRRDPRLREGGVRRRRAAIASRCCTMRAGTTRC